ncbi:MAG: DUF535 family protein [Hyphomicrobiales bacterium]|nr:DUF535 family protein [Hyphomicrobiales bacterium]
MSDAAELFDFLVGYGRREGGYRMRSLARRAFATPRASAAWLRRLDSYRAFHGLARQGADLAARKPSKDYLRLGFDVPSRIELLAGHHEFAAVATPRALLAALWRCEETTLAELAGRSGVRYRLRLNLTERSPFEGEWEIAFERIEPDGRPSTMAGVAFLLGAPTPADPSPVLLIGGMQGALGGLDKKEIVAATRDLKGLRPKHAALLAVQALAARVGCRAVFAVSNEAHVINAKRATRRDGKQADYDSFWRERGGVEHPHLGFELPVLADRSKPERAAIVAGIEALFPARA